MEAYNKEEKAKWERDSWFTAQIIGCLTGKRINPVSLLPEEFKDKAKIMTKEERKKEKREVKKQLGIK